MNKTIYTALMKAQESIGPIVKDNTATVPTKSGGSYKYQYADLDGVIETVRGPLKENGLLFYQPLQTNLDRMLLRTVLVHAESGETIESECEVRCKDPNDPQQVGGSITYFRRYQLLSLLGLAPEDDDANAASGRSTSSASSNASAVQYVKKDENAPSRAASAPQNVDTTTGEIAPDNGYFNEYEGKWYMPAACSVCGKRVTAKSVSFTMNKYNRVLCWDDQKKADESDLPFDQAPGEAL